MSAQTKGVDVLERILNCGEHMQDVHDAVAELIEALRECISDIKLTESCYGQHAGAQDAIRRGESDLARCGGA